MLAQPDESISAAGAKPRQRTRHERKRTNAFGYVFIGPAVLLYLVFSVWPLVRGVLLAFTDYRFLKPESRWDFNGVDNVRAMFQDKIFWSALGITVRYSVTVFALVVVIALVVALLIARVQRGSGFYRWIMYLPAILPVAVTFLMFGEMFNFKFGFFNTILRDLGIKNVPNWLGSAQYVLPTLMIADVWRLVGLPILLFLIGLYTINGDLYEAAALDGASTWQQFWRITLPLLKPSFLLVMVLNLGIFSVAEPMLLLTNGGPQNASRTLGFYAYQLAFKLGDLRLGYASTVSLFLGLVSGLIALLLYRVLRSDDAA